MTENTAAALPDTRDRRAFLAPLLSTVVTVPMGLLSLFYAGISPMACDSCGGEVADAFDASFNTAWPVFLGGLVVVLVVLLASWFLPWRRRNSGRRVVLALVAPGAVLFNTAVFYGLVDWPA
ncbi:hypothetical protein ACIPW5_13960 [Streptomyces sp. NPDC090077]|uniref:hypothetical protein n=1 Tax=Streptomyces sp. NPDC090077 TaxID=3365938 RepID=UPI0037F3E055